MVRLRSTGISTPRNAEDTTARDSRDHDGDAYGDSGSIDNDALSPQLGLTNATSAIQQKKTSPSKNLFIILATLGIILCPISAI
jgi:hypothetical protein